MTVTSAIEKSTTMIILLMMQLLSVVTHSAGNGLGSSDLPQFEITWILLQSLTQVTTAVKDRNTNFLALSPDRL